MLPECPADGVKTIFSRLTSFELKRNGKPFTVSYSQGVAQYQVGDTPKEMIRRADERLYAERLEPWCIAGPRTPRRNAGHRRCELKLTATKLSTTNLLVAQPTENTPTGYVGRAADEGFR